jgi:hypothetical protein
MLVLKKFKPVEITPHTSSGESLEWNVVPY